MLSQLRNGNELKEITKGMKKAQTVLNPEVRMDISDSWIYSYESDFKVQVTVKGLTFMIPIVLYEEPGESNESREDFYYNQIIAKVFKMWCSVIFDMDAISNPMRKITIPDTSGLTTAQY